jgi:uncharacterized membrane protein YgdD (TMEM256/DUF423 family)
MQPRAFGIAGALCGLTGVALGAFGAHALTGYTDAAGLSSWDTAVVYQLAHAVVLMLLSTSSSTSFLNNSALCRFAGWCLLVGVILFSGSIYLLVLGGPRFLGPVTPLGGTAFLIGWAALVVQALRASR